MDSARMSVIGEVWVTSGLGHPSDLCEADAMAEHASDVARTKSRQNVSREAWRRLLQD
jgi:hypothetical protein